VGTLTLSNAIAGTGELIKDNTVSVRLLGSNTMSGPVTINRGNLTIGSGGLGHVSTLTLNGVGGGDGTTLTLRDDAIVGAGVALSLTATDSNNRAGILNEAGTNIVDGAITLNGAGPAIVRVIAGRLEINGPISGPSFTDLISFRGGGTNIIRSQFTIPSAGMQKDDAGVWELNSANNSFAYLRIIAGTLKLLNDNALAPAGHVRTDGGVLDLDGHNQTVAGLMNSRATPVTTIANSSTTADARLTVATSPTDAPWITGTILADATTGGTRKVSLTLGGGGTVIFTNASTFSGDTLLNAGTLAFSGNGAFVNSSPINLAAGTTIDASGRNDATLTINASQVLKGNGAFNVLGNVVNNGTLEFKVSKAGATLSNDSLNGATAVTYGGTLRLVISASPALATTEAFKLFSAGSYSGSFASIEPAVPAFGLAWDTSTLAADGTLRVKQGAVANPTNIAATVVSNGAVLQISWPAEHTGWTLQGQTNGLDAGLSSNWGVVPGSPGTNQVWLPINKANGTVFYRLIYP
ncbi:MAG TPA: hypothetical protein VN673_03910, partial [Clostridia bacterium]|nr:hypothetical protein [Clostridia bacterium]